MYTDILIQAGLSREQAALYETLVREGVKPASTLARLASLSRPMAYKVLDQLIELGLVEKREEKGAVAHFNAAHPLKIKERLEQEKTRAGNALDSLGGALEELTSAYNLAIGKPGVRFYEGFEGVRTVLEDSLTAKSEIYSYADLESIQKYIPEINTEYVKKRERLGIGKKGIILDTPFARNFLKNYFLGITETRLIKIEVDPFHTIMQIYDGKISYITLSEKNIIGVTIEDQHIFHMHKCLFEYLWGYAAEPLGSG